MSTENQSQVVSIRQQIERAQPTQLAALPDVGDRFKQLFKTFHGRDGAAVYEAEKFHFAKILKDSDKLSNCTKLSMYGCFLDMAVNGLSFDPAMKHAYLVPFSVNTKKKDPQTNKEIWESRAQLQISGIGELALRIKQGQIKYADNPVLVFKGDAFAMGTKNNELYLTHEAKIPRESDEIIACYLRITRNDNSIDYKVLTMPEIQKIRAFSKDPNSKAWTDGLPGMVQAKTIKHAFRTYPKLKALTMAKFTQLESNTLDTDHVEAIDIYGMDESEGQHQPGSSQSEPVKEKPTMLSEAIKEKDVHTDGPDTDFTAPDAEEEAGKQIDDENF